ncbi:Sorting nexin-29 [Tritrichomonas musculus]|uniref:Sorting nexin-29 n=1 Tax=Tritrichomonas musculus TaxID=1915356 RepID=A0ABR2IYH7_9EUKA
MIVIPLSSLPLKKQYILSKSPLNPPMYATIEGHHYHKTQNAIYYDIQIGIQKGQDVICSMVMLRYSELEQLQKTLVNSFPDIEVLEKFPPKRWFNNTNEAFILEREKGLQNFLTVIFAIPAVTETDAFKSLFKLERSINV